MNCLYIRPEDKTETEPEVVENKAENDVKNGDGSLNGGIWNLHCEIGMCEMGHLSGIFTQNTFLLQCSKQKTSSFSK